MRIETFSGHSLHTASDVQLKVLESLVHDSVRPIIKRRKRYRYTPFPDIHHAILSKNGSPQLTWCYFHNGQKVGMTFAGGWEWTHKVGVYAKNLFTGISMC
jgi:hypothetical protein